MPLIPSTKSSDSCSHPCAKCVERAETDLERARKMLSELVDKRNETPPPPAHEFDAAVTHMQDARERYTKVALQNHCYCPEEKTRP
jgi:hypothetical protein